MKERSPGIITQLLNNRIIFIELVIATVILALSINLISSSVIELKWISPLWAFYVACFLTVVSTIYFVVRLLWSRALKHAFHGFLIIHKKKNEVMDVLRYDYGQDLYRYMRAAFAENAAIKKMWDKEPISKDFDFDKETGKVSHTKGKGRQLIVEATEYYILENLSSHLTDYFNQPKFDEEYLHVFTRKDIPEVLLSNRFLEMFSKPMEDRPLFAGEEHAPPHYGEVVMVTSAGGALYSRFDLTLPKGAAISRGKSNELVISTNRFEMIISVDFGGFGAAIPWEYQRHILRIDPKDCHDYQVGVNLNVSFKFASLFLPGGWEYYRWIESFIESFDANFSEERHFIDIGWESVLTLIQYHENQKDTARQKANKQTQEKN